MRLTRPYEPTTLHAFLRELDETGTCIATVQQKDLDLSGDGNVGLYKVRVLSVRQLSDDGAWTAITDPSLEISRKFAPFIAAFLVDHLPARHSAEITFDLGRKTHC